MSWKTIPTSLINVCVDELAPIVARIVNLSLSTGTFPDQHKQAIIRPLLKKPNLEKEMKNYRPVSILAYRSKIIEEAAGRQMAQHLEKNSLNEMFQSAYKKDIVQELL